MIKSHNIPCFQGANLPPVAPYKTWWIVGLWGQGDTMCPVCTRKSTPEGDAGATCSGTLVLKAGLRCPSAYPGTSVPAICSPSVGWNPNRKRRMSDAASHLGLCNYRLSSCWGKPAEVLPLSVSFILSVLSSLPLSPPSRSSPAEKLKSRRLPPCSDCFMLSFSHWWSFGNLPHN